MRKYLIANPHPAISRRSMASHVDPQAYRIADPFNSTEMERMFQVLPAGASGFSLSLAQAREAKGGQKGGRVRRSQGLLMCCKQYINAFSLACGDVYICRRQGGRQNGFTRGECRIHP